MKTRYKRFASKMRDDLLRQLKIVSAVEGKQIQVLLEEAVIQYLEKRQVKEEETNDGKWTVRFSMAPKDPANQNEE